MDVDDPGFCNPKGRAPIFFHAAAARSYLPRTIKKAELMPAGRTKAQMMEAIVAAIGKKELSAMEHLTTFLVPVREWSDGTADH